MWSVSTCEGLSDNLILISCFLPKKNGDPVFICQALCSLKSPISVPNVSFSFAMILQSELTMIQNRTWPVVADTCVKTGNHRAGHILCTKIEEN